MTSSCPTRHPALPVKERDNDRSRTAESTPMRSLYRGIYSCLGLIALGPMKASSQMCPSGS
jgi:hypothetical protein